MTVLIEWHPAATKARQSPLERPHQESSHVAAGPLLSAHGDPRTLAPPSYVATLVNQSRWCVFEGGVRLASKDSGRSSSLPCASIQAFIASRSWRDRAARRFRRDAGRVHVLRNDERVPGSGPARVGC
jgi:hypothetical protein